jgi:biopolymer transport protein ExbD
MLTQRNRGNRGKRRAFSCSSVPLCEPVFQRRVRIPHRLEPGGRYFLNRQPVARERLTEELGAVFAGRTRKVLFVKGAEALAYGEVVGAVDASRAAGVQVVGLVPRS